MRDVTLIAADISCEHCRKTIEGGLGAMTGVRTVTVDIPAKIVHIEYDENAVDEPALEAELDELGYPVG
jgi:copper chaperone